jgi:4-amino-4-deoxy-L-arabinose transferase-like glycosyltransferase
MNPSRLRKIVLLYPLLLILCGIGYAKYDGYQLDGDAVAFMDIADAIHTHHFALAVNGYWNPAYAAALAVGEAVAHPSRWNELQTFYWVNFWIFVGCIVACIYFVRSLLLLRERCTSDALTLPALTPNTLLLASLALLFCSFQRELAIGAVRSDSLLLFFFFFSASFLLRLQSGGRFVYYPLLGLALGLAYLTKSFAFLPSGFLLAAIFIFAFTRKSPLRGRILTGVLVAGFVFAAVAGPYIVAISKQRGRPTTGESARLNYCFFVDNTARWHEWHSGDLGHATADFKHHEQLIVASPPVYSYALHPIGTYPLWFDPSYWTDTIHPRFYLKGHLLRLARNSVVLVRFIVGHLESFVLLGVLLLAGCFVARRRASWLPLLPVPLWGLLMICIYFPIDFQDRYLTAALLLIIIPVLAMLRRSASGYAGEVATALAVLLAALTVADAASDLGQRRRILSVTGYSRGAYSKEIYPAAKGLQDLGILPGQTVACFGDMASYVDIYWARLAGTPIRAEIEVPNGGDAGEFWNAQTNKAEVLNALRVRNIAAIVAAFRPSSHIPEGWRQLGTSDFYAYPLSPSSSGNAAAILR